MKKLILFLAIILSFGLATLNANADILVLGQYGVSNGAIGGNYTSGITYRSQVEIGAADRAHANYINKLSGAGRSYSNSRTVAELIFSLDLLRQKIFGNNGKPWKTQELSQV